jgi:8-oxo-dGTP diphosphatase
MSDGPTKYVLGFLFDPSQKDVVLIKKIKPEWQKGKLNGVGGKIEEGESPVVAMRREFKEETGVEIEEWREFLQLSGHGYCIHTFVAFSLHVYTVKSMEKEKVKVYKVNRLDFNKTIGNLRWIIPLAIDKDLLYSIARETV